MKPRKKKSNRDKLTAEAYKLWCKLVHAKGQCELCFRSEGKLDAHHICGRQGVLKYWLDNGILLCFQCHRLGAHSEAWDKQDEFHKKLKALRGEENLEELKRIKHSGIKLGVHELEELVQDYKLKLGQYLYLFNLYGIILRFSNI